MNELAFVETVELVRELANRAKAHDRGALLLVMHMPDQEKADYNAVCSAVIFNDSSAAYHAYAAQHLKLESIGFFDTEVDIPGLIEFWRDKVDFKA